MHNPFTNSHIETIAPMYKIHAYFPWVSMHIKHLLQPLPPVIRGGQCQQEEAPDEHFIFIEKFTAFQYTFPLVCKNSADLLHTSVYTYALVLPPTHTLLCLIRALVPTE